MQQLNSDLLAICYDSPASPKVHFKKGNRPDGWGFAWYPRDGVGASVLKDPHVEYDMAVATAVQRWDRFRSSIFICHSGTHRGRSFTDTHPFVRSHAGRDWIFAHNGELGRNLDKTLPLDEALGFEPVGHTDSEHAFCWLMGQVRAAGARGFSDLGWETIRDWLHRLNQLGTLNAIWSDGLHVLAYHDRGGFNALHHLRRVPPPSSVTLESDLLELDVSSSVDENRTLAIISTRPLSDEPWTRLAPGEMRVVSRGRSIETGLLDVPVKPVPVETARSSWTQSKAEAPQVSVKARPRPKRSVPGPALPPLDSRHGNSRTYQITHETVYRYETPVETSSHTVRLQPVRDLTQDVSEYMLEISPPGQSFSYEDVFGNHVLSFQINQPYTELWVRVQAQVTTYHVDTHSSLRSTNIPLVWMPWQRQMMNPYLLPPELPESELRELSGFAMSFAARRAYDLLETLIDLNETLHRDFKYIPGVTTLETSPFEVYTERRGVCQDFANLFICLARLLGVPARYRVGYIHTGSKYHNQIQSDASHAWAEVYLPSVGWRGFDPTNGCLVDLDHIRVASGRNYRDATPTAGTLYAGGHGERLEVSVRVNRVDQESPAGAQAQQQAQQ
ncbi:MAG TPA: class II glutamine amidotransferase [Polyangiales bacterium]|nr:class II glutamine amidotransferase [Polyangiales bacterium]